jgi:hypothetical protein
MSNGIGKNPLNDISKVYLEMRETYKIEPPKEKLKTDRNMFNIPKDEQDAARERLKAKTAAKRAKMKEALDPVGKEDGDVNNDGKKDSTDGYLMKRRKAIAKAMKTRKEEIEMEGVRDMNPEQGTAERKARLEKKRGMKMDDHPEYKQKEKKESYSDWRSDLVEADLIEVMDEDEIDKPIKEKKVNNKVKINPKLGEAIEEIGGALIEEVEIDDLEESIESVYSELIEEGYSEDDVEDAIEYALEAKVTFGHDTESPRQKMLKKAKGRLKFLGRKAGEVASSAKDKAGQVAGDIKKKAANKAVDVAFAADAAKEKAKSAAMTVKKRVADAPKVAKSSIKDRIKKGALAVAKRMSEESVDEKFDMAADSSKPQSPNPTKLPKSREKNIGKHNDYKDDPNRDFGVRPEKGKKLKSRLSAVVGTQRRQDKETGVTEEVSDKLVSERTRFAKETGKDFKTGNPSEKGGTRTGTSVFDKVSANMRKTGGMMSARGKAIQPQGKKKEKGAKGYAGVTPVDKIRNKLSQNRAEKPNPYRARAGESD